MSAAFPSSSTTAATATSCPLRMPAVWRPPASTFSGRQTSAQPWARRGTARSRIASRGRPRSTNTGPSSRGYAASVGRRRSTLRSTVRERWPATWARDGPGPRGMVVLTFDDGFATLHEHAFPILAAAHLPATIFLVADTLTPEGRTVDWVEPSDNPPEAPLPTLALDQILEMQEAGISFGSHSYAHHDLTQLGEQECERDLRQSRELLESLLGRPVPFLAFPFGRHDERVRRAARRAGYAHAFSLPDVPEPADPYALPRMGVLPNIGLGMLAIKTSWWYPRLRVTRPYAAARDLLRRGGGSHARA